MGKFLGKVAGFHHGSVTAGGSRFQPAQATHLGAVGQHSPSGGEVIGDRPWQKSIAAQSVYLCQSGEVEQQIRAMFQAIARKHLNRQATLHQSDRRRIEARSHIALPITGGEQICRALGMGAIGCHTSVNQCFCLGQSRCGDRHRGTHLKIGKRAGTVLVEIGIGIGEGAVIGAVAGVEAKGKCRRDRHTPDAIGTCPGEGVGMNPLRTTGIDLVLQGLKGFWLQAGLSRWKLDGNQIFRRNLALLLIILTNLYTQGICPIDNHRQVTCRQARIGVGGGGDRLTALHSHQEKNQNYPNSLHLSHGSLHAPDPSSRFPDCPVPSPESTAVWHPLTQGRSQSL